MLRLSGAEGVNVRTVRSADHVATPATAGPASVPSCSTTSVSMPGIIGPLNVRTTGCARSTPVAAFAGETPRTVGDSTERLGFVIMDTSAHAARRATLPRRTGANGV